ncbi:MAG: GNAT family N-acetyltransferase [Candidatus Cloacimonetes bacterium]|nr:GNAT family N-acetyltransferase [Candidatus Cloacimonadota bacterium]
MNIEFTNHLNIQSQGFNQAEVVDFLHTHLDEFRDVPSAISKSIDYALSTEPGKGGFILVAREEQKIVGALIMNSTGMQEFIPPNILVYIAVDAKIRGKGIGKQLIDSALANCEGSIALHVEYDNPAIHLYEKLGFSTKYAEMRLSREG